jgi:hypothetical protein
MFICLVILSSNLTQYTYIGILSINNGLKTILNKKQYMKKLLLAALLILANTGYSQFSNRGCGWEFRSTRNAFVNTETRQSAWRSGRIELYYNETCEKFLRICYVNGSNEYYYAVTESPVSSSRTLDGDLYYTYNLRDYSTKELIKLQIIYSNPPIVRVHYKDAYIEYHE